MALQFNQVEMAAWLLDHGFRCCLNYSSGPRRLPG
jgi:hypothetical protein